MKSEAVRCETGKSKTVVNAAKFVSLVLNPFVLLIPFQVLMFNISGLSLTDQRLILVLVLQVVSALLYVLIAKRLGYIKNLQMTDIADRKMFLFLMVLLFALSVFVTKDVPFLAVVNLALTCTTLFLALATSVFAWKASGHLAYYTVMFVFLVSIDYRFALLSVCIPLLMWARVADQKHDLAQTAGGVLIGLISSLSLFLLT